MTKTAVIMAAGKGVRMMPLTKLVPKSLIQINGRPFLFYLLKRLRQAGYTNIGIIVGYQGKQIEKYLKQINFKARIIYQRRRLGTGHALRLAKSFAGSNDLIVLGGDNLWSVRDLKLVSRHDGYNYVSVIKVREPQCYGVVIGKNNLLERIIEKPKYNAGNLVNTGLYKFTPEIFQCLDRLKKSPRGEYELTDALTELATNQKVRIVKLKDYWIDLGTLEDIPKVEEFLKKRKE